MQKILYLIANGMAGYLDFCVGVLITSVVMYFSGSEQTVWVLCLGGVLGFLPDFDILYPILAGKEIVGDHHETPMHRPILLLTATTVVAGLFGGWTWALTAFLCVLWHYCHDMRMFGGGGIAFLWPVSKRPWSFLGWETRDRLINHKDWLLAYWLQPSVKSISEILLGSVILACVMTVLWSGLWATALFVVTVIGMLAVWEIQDALNEENSWLAYLNLDRFR